MRSLPPLATLACCLLACGDDDGAELHGPTRLALGGIAHFSVGDECTGFGLVCSSEGVREIDAVLIDDPNVVQLVDHDALPPLFAQLDQGSGFVLEARAEGASWVVVKSQFSDGSQRRAEKRIEVRTPDSFTLDTGCDLASSAPNLVMAGRPAGFTLQLRAGDEGVAGFFDDPARGEGVSCEADKCRWDAPEEPGVSVRISAPIVPGFHATLTSYGPNDVTVIQTSASNQGKVEAGALGVRSYTLQVDGKVPCQAFGLHVQSLTPEICTGPQGEPTWDETLPPSLTYRVVASGRCELELSVLGARRPVTRLPFKVQVRVPTGS